MKPTYLTFRTNRNRRIWVRPMTCQDAPLLIDIFAHLSPQSRYLRFHESLDAPDPALVEERAREMATIAPDRGRGWLAFANIGGRKTPVGGARWVRVDDETAEIALTVRDDFQGQGIGRQLLRVAVLDADAAGISKLTAVVHGSNQAAMQLLRYSPVPLQRDIHAGEMYVEIDLRQSGLVEHLREDALVLAA